MSDKCNRCLLIGYTRRSSYMLKFSTKYFYKLHGFDGVQRKIYIDNPGVFHDF